MIVSIMDTPVRNICQRCLLLPFVNKDNIVIILLFFLKSTFKLTTSDKFLFTGKFHEKGPAVSMRRLRSL